jgi:hypothetical protein
VEGSVTFQKRWSEFAIWLQELFNEIKEGSAALMGLAEQVYNKITWLEIWEFTKTRFPPITWIPEYNLEKFKLDLTV